MKSLAALFLIKAFILSEDKNITFDKKQFFTYWF